MTGRISATLAADNIVRIAPVVRRGLAAHENARSGGVRINDTALAGAPVSRDCLSGFELQLAGGVAPGHAASGENVVCVVSGSDVPQPPAIAKLIGDASAVASLIMLPKAVIEITSASNVSDPTTIT